MSKVKVHKAQSIMREDGIPNLEILADEEIREAKDVGGNRPLFAQEAAALALALRRSLPGGTLDMLLVELLRLKAGELIVPYESAIRYRPGCVAIEVGGALTETCPFCFATQGEPCRSLTEET